VFSDISVGRFEGDPLQHGAVEAEIRQFATAQGVELCQGLAIDAVLRDLLPQRLHHLRDACRGEGFLGVDLVQKGHRFVSLWIVGAVCPFACVRVVDP